MSENQQIQIAVPICVLSDQLLIPKFAERTQLGLSLSGEGDLQMVAIATRGIATRQLVAVEVAECLWKTPGMLWPSAGIFGPMYIYIYIYTYTCICMHHTT